MLSQSQIDVGGSVGADSQSAGSSNPQQGPAGYWHTNSPLLCVPLTGRVPQSHVNSFLAAFSGGLDPALPFCRPRAR